MSLDLAGIESAVREFVSAPFHLVELEIAGSTQRPTIKVFVDTAEGITVGQCRELSRALSDHLSIEDLDYALEVSSPGLDRPLQDAWQFQKNIDRKLRVEMVTEEGREMTFVATLARVKDDKIYFEQSSKSNIPSAVSLDQIKRARVEPKW